MSGLFTDASVQVMAEVANRYQVSFQTVQELSHALIRSNGTMAQFNLPELGGSGQWMQGGMTMVGDMFNNQLKFTVDGLCIDLSNLIIQGSIQYKPLLKKSQDEGGFQGGNWWGDLGIPNSSGSQNDMHYAIFSNPGRLAIKRHGQVTVYDTLDHQINGVGQQQGGSDSVNFTSQYGNVSLSDLPVISGENKPKDEVKPQPGSSSSVQAEEPIEKEEKTPNQDILISSAEEAKTKEAEDDIFEKIEKLAALKEKGILTQKEFDDKKTELLRRI